MNRLTRRVVVLLGVVGLLAGPGQAAPWNRAQRAALFRHVPAGLVQADTDGNKLFDNLEAKLGTTAPAVPLDVIVRFKSGHESAASRLGSHVRRRLRLDRSVSANLTAAEIRTLAASDAVESIEPNILCHISRETSQASFGVTKARADFGITGDGDGNPTGYSARDATIAILDTGIDINHPDFANGKVIGWQDYINSRTTPYDDHGHGTHVSSIAAGGVVNGVGGVAPGAALVGVKIADSKGDSRTDIIATAVDWCTQNRVQYGIEVLNISLGSAGSSNGQDALSRAVNRAVDAGLVVCVAAGNEGPNSFSIGTPAAAAGAITVGNMRDTSKAGFALDPSSSRGPTADGRVKPDICAPGYMILAARANTSSYVRMTGTSMASPFVAGFVALMRQANPALTPSQVKTLLKETAVHFGPPGENSDFGAGRLDGYAALARASGNTGTPPDAPDHRYIEGTLAGATATQRWTVSIVDTRFPIAATLIQQDAGTDFDLYLLDPSGATVASATGFAREEIIGYFPTRTGTFTLLAYSDTGSGRYYIDASVGTGLGQSTATNRIAIFRLSTREWFIRDTNGQAAPIQFGGPGDQPVPTDYLGTGKAQIAIYRPTTGDWYIRNDSGGATNIQFGGAGDLPVPADYLGLSRAQVGVYRPSTGQWFTRKDDGSAVTVQFGGPEDIPVPADYLKLKHAQISVYRPGAGKWFIRNDAGGALEYDWGGPGDVPVPGDYQGVSHAQICVFRPSTAQWFIRGDDGQATVITFGQAGDIPVPFDYTGSGRFQIAVFRPTTGQWFFRDSSGGSTNLIWGGPGDQPVPALYPAR